MLLHIDSVSVSPKIGESLLDIVRNNGLDSDKLSQMPLAAKIAGEIFNLNYVPVRNGDTTADPSTMRRAMAASDGEIHLIRYSDQAGKDVYMRTTQFVLFLALHRLWPTYRAKMNCTVGQALYIELPADCPFNVDTLRGEIKRIIHEDFPLIRKHMTTQEAIRKFESEGQSDKAALLRWRKAQNFSFYTCDDFADYYYGELAPSTGYVKTWEILPIQGGFLFLYPDDKNPDQIVAYSNLPKLLSVSTEGERWCELMGCENVSDLNRLVESDKIRELIRVNEALHEKRFSQVADMICDRGVKAVMVAGPSSSGKTTSANRLATQLRVHGKKPILISLDDFYVDRDKIPVDAEGKQDFEHINTIDTHLFRHTVKDLIRGEEVRLPTYNFLTGKREWHDHVLKMTEDTVIITEGLHALNPQMFPTSLDPSLMFKLFVSPILPLNLDDHNRIPSSLLRLLRRTVRDYETRGASVQKTISMWDSVRAGEERWIFPYQESSDVHLNSATLYELAVLKKHIFPLLAEVPPEDAAYDRVRSLVKILNYVLEADVDDEIPPTSLVREFIGGNSFYR